MSEPARTTMAKHAGPEKKTLERYAYDRIIWTHEPYLNFSYHGFDFTRSQLAEFKFERSALMGKNFHGESA